MAQLSDVLLQVAVLVYLAAMMGYLVEFAFGRQGAVARVAARPDLVTVGAAAAPISPAPPVAPAVPFAGGRAARFGAVAVGLSVLSGAHNYLFKRVLELLKEKGAEDIAVFGGGIIPAEDIRALKAMGVKELFTPGTSTQDIVRFVRDNIRAAV